MRDPLALIRQTPAPLIEIGRAMPPIPCWPDAAEPPRWFKVTPTAGVPAVLFRRAFTDACHLSSLVTSLIVAVVAIPTVLLIRHRPTAPDTL